MMSLKCCFCCVFFQAGAMISSLFLYRSGTVNDVVKIGGVNCVISSTTNTQIVCATDQAPNSMKTQVSVEIDGNGVAKQVYIIL